MFGGYPYQIIGASSAQHGRFNVHIHYFVTWSGSLIGIGSYVPLNLSTYGLALCIPVAILCRMPSFPSSSLLVSFAVVYESWLAAECVESMEALFLCFFLSISGKVRERGDDDVGEMGAGCASS
jgi:hypothetical protein